jgi:hypothetical protein
MIKKITLILAATGVLGWGSMAFADTTTSTDATLQQEIKALQAQIKALETKVDKSESKKSQAESKTSSDSASVSAATHSKSGLADPKPLFNEAGNVYVGHYVGLLPAFNGSNLIINNPGVNNDVALLKIRKAEMEAYESASQAYEDEPKIIFSGSVEGTATYTTPYNSTSAGTAFDLSSAELDSFIEGNRWVNGFMTFTYNSGGEGQANEVNNSDLQLGQGFVTIGDLTTTPVYGSFGQMYMPFGRYTSYMISSPSTKTLGRIQARGMNLGYHADNEEVSPFAAVYGYQGSTEIDGNEASNDDVEDYGANAGLNFSHGDYSATLGTSYTSNIASSSGFQGDGSEGSGFSQSSTSEDLANRVPGVDVNALFSYTDYTLLAEYVTATEEFNQNDLSYNGSGAKPQALDVEFAYAFTLWHPSYVAAAYGQSWQALSLGVPRKNYGIVYNTSIWRNTALSFELMHNIGYSSSDSAELDGEPTANNASQGESYNTVNLRFDLFF